MGENIKSGFLRFLAIGARELASASKEGAGLAGQYLEKLKALKK